MMGWLEKLRAVVGGVTTRYPWVHYLDDDCDERCVVANQRSGMERIVARLPPDDEGNAHAITTLLNIAGEVVAVLEAVEVLRLANGDDERGNAIADLAEARNALAAAVEREVGE